MLYQDRIETNFLQLLLLFLGQHCCLTEASIISNDFFVFYLSFHCIQQPFYCLPAVPCSVVPAAN